MAEKQAFGDVLMQLRKQRGLTQQDVADQIGVTRSAVYGFEKGRSFPVPDKLVTLARYFEVSVDYMLTGENYTPPAKAGSIPSPEDTDIKNSVVSEPAPPSIKKDTGVPISPSLLRGDAIERPGMPGLNYPAPENKPKKVGLDLVDQIERNTEDIRLLKEALVRIQEQLK